MNTNPQQLSKESSERLADLALGHLRVKIPQLQTALEGQVRDHHRFLLRSLLRQLQFLEAEIELLDALLDQIGREHLDLAEALHRWITVPGIVRPTSRPSLGLPSIRKFTYIDMFGAFEPSLFLNSHDGGVRAFALTFWGRAKLERRGQPIRELGSLELRRPPIAPDTLE